MFKFSAWMLELHLLPVTLMMEQQGAKLLVQGLLHYVVKVPVVMETAETVVQYMASFVKGAL